MDKGPEDLDFRRGLKRVVKLAVHRGGQEALASVSGRIRRAAAFSDYGNEDIPDRHMPIDVAVEVDLYNGRPLILTAMAKLLGCIVVSMPNVVLTGTKLGRLTGEAMRETGEVFSELGDILDDGKVTSDEVPGFENHVDDAIAKLVALKLQVRREAGLPVEGDEP